MSKFETPRYALFFNAVEQVAGLRDEDLNYCLGGIFHDTMHALARHSRNTNWRFASTRFDSKAAFKRSPRQQLGQAGEILVGAAVSAYGSVVTLTPKDKDHDLLLGIGLDEFFPIEVKTASETFQRSGLGQFVFTGIDTTYEKAFAFVMADREFIEDRAAYPLIAVCTSTELLTMGLPASGTLNLVPGSDRGKTTWLTERATSPADAVRQIRKLAKAY